MSQSVDRQYAARGRLLNRARALAREGSCCGWDDVFRRLSQESNDASILLEPWMTALERNQIDLLCDAAQKRGRAAKVLSTY